MSFDARTVIGSRFQSGGAEMPKARFPITLVAGVGVEWEAEWQRNGPDEILEEAELELICNGYEKKAGMVGHVNRGWEKKISEQFRNQNQKCIYSIITKSLYKVTMKKFRTSLRSLT